MPVENESGGFSFILSTENLTQQGVLFSCFSFFTKGEPFVLFEHFSLSLLLKLKSVQNGSCRRYFINYFALFMFPIVY